MEDGAYFCNALRSGKVCSVQPAPHIAEHNIASTLKTLKHRGWIDFRREERNFDVRFIPHRTEKGDQVLWSAILKELDR
jgi:hypothetical protein